MTAYYSEHDKFAAAWLRELIKSGLIADGEVDERDIQQVEPGDLRGFTQCHFFAGIGVWSYALRSAGWADDTPVWTGSCPCQGFSTSGKREGFSDQRHLWPTWFGLIRECAPVTVFGEQVASKDGLAWFDVVSADMEGEGYTIGACDTCAAGFGSPMVSQRLYFVAQTESERCGEAGPRSRRSKEWTADSGQLCGMDETENSHRRWPRNSADGGRRTAETGRPSIASGLVAPHNSESARVREHSRQVLPIEGSGVRRFLGGFWRDGKWIWCRDKKYRPIESGTFPLAHGVKNRVGKLRGYGNGLCAPQAQGFIEAYLALLTGDRL